MAKDVTLLIKLRDQVSGKVRAIAGASKKAEVQVKKLERAVRRTGIQLERMRRKGVEGLKAIAARAKNAAKSFGGFGKAAALAAVAAGAAAFAKFSFGAAGELERQTKSLEVLTGSLDTAKGIISELQAFGAVTPFTSQELIETSKRLKAFGFETEQVVDVTKRLADVAGATGADLGGIATAFGQIQAKGRLQTEELLQLQERGVGLGDELQKMYGMTGEEFSKALEKGQISAEAANVALIRLTEQGGKYANGAVAQSDTLFGKLSTLQDAFQRFGQNIGKFLSPIFKGIIDFLTTITNQINNLFGEMARNAAIDQQARKNLGLPAAGGGRLTGQQRARLRGERRSLREAGFGLDKLNAPKTPDMTIPELRNVVTAGGGGGDKADPLAALKRQVEALKEGVLIAKTRTKEEERQQILLNDIAALTAIRTDDNAELVDEAIKLTGQLFYQEGLQRQAAEADKKRQEAAKKLNELYKGIGDTIASSIVQSLQEAVKGTAKLADIATSMLNRLIDQFIQLALVQASGIGGPIGAIAGFLSGGRANGGTVMGGRSYVVGERGPELFTPGRTGSIAPNKAMGGDMNVVVNVDASGTEVQGNQGNADQLGRLIGQAVQAELIKQKRPGGLLTR